MMFERIYSTCARILVQRYGFEHSLVIAFCKLCEAVKEDITLTEKKKIEFMLGAYAGAIEFIKGMEED